MIRPWEKFTIIQHQVDVEYVDVIRRSRSFLLAEIGMTQKYCEVLAWTGWELHLVTSERTPVSQRNESADATSVMFPRAVRGWTVIAPSHARYSLRFALVRPAQRRHGNAMTTRDEEWRVNQVIHGK